MLRTLHDLRSLTHLAVCGGVYYLALSQSLLWILPAGFLAVHAVSIAHNHVHLPMFRLRALNVALETVLQVLCGMPQLFWKVHHVRRHHPHPWEEADWSSPYGFDHAHAPLDEISPRYFRWTYLPLFVCESIVEILRHRRPAELKGLAWVMIVYVGSAAAISWYFGPLRWLAVFGYCYFNCGMGLASLNYVQHWACYRGTGTHLAWTFTCPIHNALTYNSGYHYLHHLQPGLHWSELPRAHREDSSYTRPDLIENGLFPGYRGSRGMQAWLDEQRRAQQAALWASETEQPRERSAISTAV